MIIYLIAILLVVFFIGLEFLERLFSDDEFDRCKYYDGGFIPHCYKKNKDADCENCESLK